MSQSPRAKTTVMNKPLDAGDGAHFPVMRPVGMIDQNVFVHRAPKEKTYRFG